MGEFSRQTEIATQNDLHWGFRFIACLFFSPEASNFLNLVELTRLLSNPVAIFTASEHEESRSFQYSDCRNAPQCTLNDGLPPLPTLISKKPEAA